MRNKIKNQQSLPAGRQGGIIKLIIIIVVAFVLLRHFGITISEILGYLHLTPGQVSDFFSRFVEWAKGLFDSVKG